MMKLITFHKGQDNRQILFTLLRINSVFVLLYQLELQQQYRNQNKHNPSLNRERDETCFLRLSFLGGKCTSTKDYEQ